MVLHHPVLPQHPNRFGHFAKRTSFATVILCGALAAPVYADDVDNDGAADNADAFPCDARFSSVISVPSETGYNMLMVEDQWPEASDLDFNDAVTAFNERIFKNAAGQVVRLELNLDVLAVGGKFDNGLALHLPLPANTPVSITRNYDGVNDTLQAQPFENELVVNVLENMREAFSGRSTTPTSEEIINADAAKPTKVGFPVKVTIDFTTPVSLDTGAAPYDVYVFRSNNRKHQIHLPQFAGTTLMDQTLFNTGIDGSTSSRKFVTASGLPFALLVPSSAVHPLEGKPIETVFPDITTFAASGGVQQADFFNRPVIANAFQRGSNNIVRPNPTTLTSVAGSTSCLRRSNIAVVSGTGTGSKGAGVSLPLIKQSGFTVDVYGTASGAQPLANLYANINNYDIVLMPDFAVGMDSSLISVANTNKNVLTNWVKAGGWLFVGTYDDAGGWESTLVNMPGLSIAGSFAGSDNRSTSSVINDSPILHVPFEIQSQLQANFGWEHLASYPTESTNRRDILRVGSNGYLSLAEFDLQQGHVIVEGQPIITNFGGIWPGAHERFSIGPRFYTNLLSYMTGNSNFAGGSQFRTCKEILQAGASVGSGFYFVDSDGAGSLPTTAVFCDMTSAGGGWTLVWEQLENYSSTSTDISRYQNNTQPTVVSSTESMFAYLSNGYTVNNAWRFPTVSNWKSAGTPATPFTALQCGETPVTATRISDNTSVTDTLVWGSGSFSTRCDHSCSSTWGRICLRKSGSFGAFDFPFYSGWMVTSNTCSVSSDSDYRNGGSCPGADRRFAMFVR